MRFSYVLIGAISFLVALLLTLPAEKALDWVGGDTGAQIHFIAPRGGIATGSAAAVSVNGFLLQETRWRLRLSSFVKGRLGYSIDSQIEGRPAHMLVEFGLGGKTHIHDLQATLALPTLRRLSPKLILPVDGQVQADFDYLLLQGEKLRNARGELKLRNASWILLKPAAALGDFSLRLAPVDDGRITGTLTDENGSPLNANGEISLDQDGQYQVDLSLRLRANMDERMRDLMKGLGRPDAQGWYKLKTQGRI